MIQASLPPFLRWQKVKLYRKNRKTDIPSKMFQLKDLSECKFLKSFFRELMPKPRTLVRSKKS